MSKSADVRWSHIKEKVLRHTLGTKKDAFLYEGLAASLKDISEYTPNLRYVGLPRYDIPLLSHGLLPFGRARWSKYLNRGRP